MKFAETVVRNDSLVFVRLDFSRSVGDLVGRWEYEDNRSTSNSNPLATDQFIWQIGSSLGYCGVSSWIFDWFRWLINLDRLLFVHRERRRRSGKWGRVTDSINNYFRSLSIEFSIKGLSLLSLTSLSTRFVSWEFCHEISIDWNLQFRNWFLTMVDKWSL